MTENVRKLIEGLEQDMKKPVIGGPYARILEGRIADAVAADFGKDSREAKAFERVGLINQVNTGLDDLTRIIKRSLSAVIEDLKNLL